MEDLTNDKTPWASMKESIKHAQHPAIDFLTENVAGLYIPKFLS